MQSAELLTAEQRDFFEEHGFLRVPGALDPVTVLTLRETCLRRRDHERAATAMPTASDDWRDQFDLPTHDMQAACDDARWEESNVVACDDVFMSVIDHRAILQAAAGLLSENIFLMGSLAMIRSQVPLSMSEFRRFPLDWHRDLGTSAVEMTQPHPRLSVKAAYWLTLLDAPGQGAMQVVPGSHRLTGSLSINPETGHPYGAIEIYAQPGDALLFDQRLWHAAAPNTTANPRICLFYAYGYRWLRPDDYRDIPPQLMDRLPPVRRQLLGAVESRQGYYLPTSADLPLRQWLRDGGHG